MLKYRICKTEKMTLLIKCNTVNLINLKESFYVTYFKVKYINWQFIDGKKLSTDNGNILNLNLNYNAILLKIVHFECQSVF